MTEEQFNNTPTTTSCQVLAPEHLNHLKASGISLEVINERGYESISDRKRLADLGFSDSQQKVPGILIPIFCVDSSGIVNYQFRPDNPRTNRGKAVKYETPLGTTNRIDSPPRCLKQLGDRATPLYITEGIKKADALASAGVCSASIQGVYGWKSKNETEGITVAADLHYLAFNRRQVYLVPDSDFSSNTHVQKGWMVLSEILRNKGANILVVTLPGKDGQKVGVDDFIADHHTIDDINALALTIDEIETAPKDEAIYRNYFWYNQKLHLEVRKFDESYAFAFLDDEGGVKLLDRLAVGGKKILPRPLPKIDGKALAIVGMPSEDITFCRLFSASELYNRIKDHLTSYIDLNELDLRLCCYYILFTWFYRKVDTVGYLRFLADTGKGKSRIQRVVADLCFYPVYASGASTFSGIARLNNKWRGTLVIDEADITGDKEDQLVKYFNLGFEKDKYYVLTDKMDTKVQEFFDPFSPKILAMRQPFRDNATEARILSISPHETTNPDIPILLPPEYSQEAQALRDKIALFVLHNYNSINRDKMAKFDNANLEPRLKQLAMPLSIVFQLWGEGLQPFLEYLVLRQKEIRKIRSQSWEGTLFNVVLNIAIGQIDFAEYGEYYDPQGQIQAVTPSMVAKYMNSKTKGITLSLASVGFEVEQREIEIHKEDKTKTKIVRTYVIPNQQGWEEMVSRYYYEGEEIAEPGIKSNDKKVIPKILRSRKFVPTTLPSPPVPTTSDTSDG